MPEKVLYSNQIYFCNKCYILVTNEIHFINFLS